MMLNKYQGRVINQWGETIQIAGAEPAGKSYWADLNRMLNPATR